MKTVLMCVFLLSKHTEQYPLCLPVQMFAQMQCLIPELDEDTYEYDIEHSDLFEKLWSPDLTGDVDSVHVNVLTVSG